MHAVAAAIGRATNIGESTASFMIIWQAAGRRRRRGTPTT